jgi:transposase-like protein
MSDTFSKVEVITGVARRRRFSTDLKLAVIAETMQPGMSISYVARRHGLSPSLVFRWRGLMNEGDREQPSLAAERNTAQRSLGLIVGQAGAAIVEEAGEGRPALEYPRPWRCRHGTTAGHARRAPILGVRRRAAQRGPDARYVGY